MTCHWWLGRGKDPGVVGGTAPLRSASLAEQEDRGVGGSVRSQASRVYFMHRPSYRVFHGRKDKRVLPD